MATIKSQSSTRDRSLKISRFGQFNSTGYYAREYVTLVNTCFLLDQYMSTDDTVIILCDIPENASGYIYGVRNTAEGYTSNRMFIKKEGSYIYWQSNNESFSALWKSGRHYLGFIDGKPFYDEVLSDRLSTGYVLGNVTVGGCSVLTGITVNTPECISQITVIQVLAIACTTQTSTQKNINSYYPASSGQAGTTAYFYSTRYRLARFTGTSGTTISGITSSATLGPVVTYGVTIDDLRTIFPSNFKDLILILCNNRYLQTWATGQATAKTDNDWTLTPDSPDVLSDGTTTIFSAFRLADGRASDLTQGTSIQIDGGFSLSRQSGLYHDDDFTYERGDLIYGQRPDWNLWADNINVGRYIKRIPITGTNLYKHYLIYNIFKSVLGDDKIANHHDLLLQWEGYSNSSTSVHAPSFSLAGEIQFDYHNGVGCTCNASSCILGYNKNTLAVKNSDEKCIFRYSLSSGGLGHVVLGNLPLWHVSAASQPSYYQVFGGVLEIKYLDNGQYRTIASIAQITTDTNQNGGLIPLSLESSSDIKTLFQSTGFDASSTFNKERVEAIGRIFRDRSWNADGVTAIASLGLLLNTTIYPEEHEIIRTDRIGPVIKTILKGHLDPYNVQGDSYSRHRFVVGEPGGTATIGGNVYEFEAKGREEDSQSNYYDFDMEWFEMVNNSPTYNARGKGVGAAFALRKSGTTEFLNMVTTPVIAYMQYTTANAQGQVTGNYYGFTQLEPTSYGSNSHWSQPYPYNWHFQGSYVFPSKYAADPDTECLAAMFRWLDLSGVDSKPSDSGTAHMRAFENTASSPAPVCWDIYPSQKDTDPTSGCATVLIGSGSAARYLLFVNNERIKHWTSTIQNIIVEAWYTKWTSLDVTGQDTSAFSSVKVELYLVPLHGPKTANVPSKVATFNMTSAGQWITSGNYSCNISQKSRYPYFTQLANGNYGNALDGFFCLQIRTDAANTYSPGAKYLIYLSTI